MADPVLHIKDAYFFEVPKFLWKRDFKSKDDVFQASPVWVELDDQFQDWEFERQYHSLTHDLGVKLPPEEQAHHDWHDWVHPHADHGHDHGHHSPNAGKPFDEFLNAKVAAKKAAFEAWKKDYIAAAKDRAEASRDADYAGYKTSSAFQADDYDSFVEKQLSDADFAAKWKTAKLEAANVDKFVKDDSQVWSKAKLAGYSQHLSGKILIPQPFGRLRNLHEPEAGEITISKFMVVELAVALIIAILFSWLARRVISGGAPKGRLWNFLETFVVFIRTEIAEPAIGGGHDDHHDDAHGHAEPGHHVDASGNAVSNAAHGHAHDSHGHDSQGHAPKKKHVHISPARKFTPLLCSIFFFVLGCNLAGMLPWIGSPTATWAVTAAMALVTFSAVVIAGMAQFGFLGFFINQVPTMDMPWYMGMVLKPAIFLIEFGGLLIKHAVLSVRLLANMVAGHLVLLAIMALAFGAEAAAVFTVNGQVGPMWWVAASAAVIGCTLLSLLELFVAFLQAYVFTLLSALFIGAAIHKH